MSPHRPKTGLNRAEPTPLTTLKPGQSATVIRIASSDPARAVRLSSLGVMPGATVTFVQRYPAVVVRVAETSIALDAGVAADILVEGPTAD